MILLIAAIALSLTNPSPKPALASNECAAWAIYLNQGADSVIMHTVGCDDAADARYEPESGRCAAIARNAFREGYAPHYVRIHTEAEGCVWLDDGTYDDARG